MGLFSKLFGSAARKKYEHPQLGTFTLVYSKNGRNLWTSGKEILFTALGNEDEPYPAHLEFLSGAMTEIEALHNIIIKRFLSHFHEAEEDIRLLDWRKRFKIVGVEVEAIKDKVLWNICFEELEAPYYHHTMHFEGRQPTDVSIDN